MSQTTIDVETPRGTMPVHLHEPDGATDAPLVVLLMDAPGIRPTLHQHAERLADAGYRVAIPDLYYAMDPADRPKLDRLAAHDPEELGRMGTLAHGVDDLAVGDDIELMLDQIAPGSRWGAVGICMGGRMALQAAQRFGGQLAAASLLHPSRLVTDAPDSPHTHLDRVGAALYLCYGERDVIAPPSAIPPLEEQLEAHGVANRIEVIPGADHGFMMPGMPGYDEAAAEQGWAGTLALLRERL